MAFACLSPFSASATEDPDLAPLFAASAPRVPFTLEAARSPDGALVLRWMVEPGNYLYRDSLGASLDGRAVPLERPVGEAKDDPNFGVVQVFHRDVEASAGALPRTGELKVAYQGCSEKGICFPPQARLVDLSTLDTRVAPPGRISATADISARSGPAPATMEPAALSTEGAVDDGEGIAALFAGSLGWTLLAFLGFGLLLALTPCVFPMIPILAGMLTRSSETLTRRRSLALTGAYVLAMAGAYGLVGAVAGGSGANLQAALQTPLALGVTATIFVLLALSMFGLFDLALPAGLSARLAGRGGSGSLGGAALLGFGSALIVGPCVTPPLAGAMLYAATTGDVVTGAGALFMLGLGMGLPLMLVGLFGPSVLPRGGAWLERAKQAFGTVFLAVAILLAGRLLPAPASLAMFGVLLLGAAAFFGGFDRLTASSGPAARLARGGGMAAALYGATLIVGAAGGAQDPLRPLAFEAVADARRPAAQAAATVTSSTSFDRAVAAAADGAADSAVPNRPILVDFTADWCTVCKANARVMAAPELRARLAAVPQVTADVTDYNATTRALMERFRVVGPPALFLVDAQGREIPGSRIVGPVTVDAILRRLDAAGA
ncbi:thiol:disulfide interchange protein DsbD [Angulomicrobium amanitiforme]|uniref:Thiol:disulfide interchange protein DsbD n=1 Tax=Ancylobacter amanitiformis TaxID=217069 RepID=A0ABU0LW82_9HYPH|nr:thiol:disulfide interchange protein DsbD [Ancylobacter amanitiformis]